MNFLPEDYNVPSESNYMKFEEGANKFRILDSAIIGWQDWDDEKKVYRYPMNEKPPTSKKKDGKIKHFWAFPVWNYKEKRVQILEVTQKTIHTALTAYVANPEWGSPTGYDITVSRKGQGLETEYTLMPSVPKAIGKEIVEAFKAVSINLNAMFEGADPFGAAEEVTEDVNPDDLPEDLA